MSALVSVIAKILVLVDSILDAFMTTSMVYIDYGSGSDDACNIPVVIVSVTACGDALIANIQLLIFYITKIGGDFFAGLTANTG